MPEINSNETYRPMTFGTIRIGLASQRKNQREWSHGERSKTETH